MVGVMGKALYFRKSFEADNPERFQNDPSAPMIARSMRQCRPMSAWALMASRSIQ
jgi:hypothetical protein